MTTALTRLRQDRRLRDAARAVVIADFDNLRANLAHKSLGERAMGRVTAGAQDVYDEALDVAADHKGALAAIVAALVLWFARHPLAELIGFGEDDAQGTAPDPEQDWD